VARGARGWRWGHGAARAACVEGRGSRLGGVGLAGGGCAELAGAHAGGSAGDWRGQE
jgi:hypothetical protein